MIGRANTAFHPPCYTEDNDPPTTATAQWPQGRMAAKSRNVPLGIPAPQSLPAPAAACSALPPPSLDYRDTAKSLAGTLARRALHE